MGLDLVRDFARYYGATTHPGLDPYEVVNFLLGADFLLVQNNLGIEGGRTTICLSVRWADVKLLKCSALPSIKI